MRYQIFLRVDVIARDDGEAYVHANKLGELLKNPMVKMAIEGEGIRIIGQPQVHMPQRDGA
jgi:hypothetical protein